MPITKNPQKTSFWDFRNKKVYINKKEKISDFLVGLLGTPILLLFFFFIFGQINLNFTFLGWDSSIFLTALIYLLILVYTLIERRYAFFGMLTGLIIIIVVYLIIILFAFIKKGGVYF